MEKISIPWAKPSFDSNELNEVIDSFSSNWLTMGPKVNKFEKEMAHLLSVPFAIAVNNGTIALDIALKSIRIKPSDEVIVPAMTYFSTASAVSYQYATPVFVDIDKESFNLDPKRIEDAISKKTKAILFIDYGGNPANFDSIKEISKKYNLSLLQDGAQSLGGIYKGKPMGAQAKISTMSFHMAKIITCVEGGMIFTHDKNLMSEVLSRRNQGEVGKENYNHVFLGTNARMTDIQAAIGLAQLKKLPIFLEKRKNIAKKYDELFNQYDLNVKTISTLRKNSINPYFLYPILIDNRDQIALYIKKKYGIDTRIAYSMPVYEQKLYSEGKAKFKKMDCPVAESITSKILNLPIFPDMNEAMIEKVVLSIKDAIIYYDL
jgi:perosamine synthetase